MAERDSTRHLVVVHSDLAEQTGSRAEMAASKADSRESRAAVVAEGCSMMAVMAAWNRAAMVSQTGIHPAKVLLLPYQGTSNEPAVVVVVAVDRAPDWEIARGSWSRRRRCCDRNDS